MESILAKFKKEGVANLGRADRPNSIAVAV